MPDAVAEIMPGPKLNGHAPETDYRIIGQYLRMKREQAKLSQQAHMTAAYRRAEKHGQAIGYWSKLHLNPWGRTVAEAA